MASSAIVVGSGAGGSVAAMVLAEAGWDVVVFEKGPDVAGDLGRDPAAPSPYSNDELKHRVRHLTTPDPRVFPQTFRAADDDPDVHVGIVSALPQMVGGGTAHWDAKVPRFFDYDFRQLTAHGPVPGADIADWPFDYGELAPFYDEVEDLLGVQGDAAALPELNRKHAPRSGSFPMPPGPQQYGSARLAEAATTIGLHPAPVPAAVNSRPQGGRPACVNCGFCAGYGCPSEARGSALDPLRRARATGRVEIVAETMVSRVVLDGRRARGVEWVRATPVGPVTGRRDADVVVLAGSATETVRLALLSQLPDAGGRIGRRLMLHSMLDIWGIFPGERMHADRGRSSTQFLEDFNDPDFPEAADAAKQAGLPYLRGGMVELGLGSEPMVEAESYRRHLKLLRPDRPFGTDFKRLMRASLLRDRFLRVAMVGTDLPYLHNTVTLDPSVTDLHGVPVPRVTYAPGLHEELAQGFYLPWLAWILDTAGASIITRTGRTGPVPDSIHVLGGMAMGTDPATSVCDGHGRVHGTDNVVVADGSVAVTSGGHNPTLTLMAVALRSVRHLVQE